MNYQEEYDKLISIGKTRPTPKLISRNRKTEATIQDNIMLTEKNNEMFYIHHIVPVCCGGTNDTDNLVFLTLEEHKLAHKLLFFIHENDKYKKSLYQAYSMMCNISSHGYYNLEDGSLHHVNEKAVVAIDVKTKEKVNEFATITEANIFYNTHHIYSVLNGKCRTCANHYWMLKSDWDNLEIRKEKLASFKPPIHCPREKITYEVELKNGQLNIIKEFFSPKKLSEEEKLSYQHITSVLRGEIAHIHNRVFILKKDYDNIEKRKAFIKNLERLILCKKAMNGTKIVQLDKEKKHCLGVYVSMQEAGRCLNIAYPINISAVCRKKMKSYKGYIWMYEQDFLHYIDNLEFSDIAKSLLSEFNDFNNKLYRVD